MKNAATTLILGFLLVSLSQPACGNSAEAEAIAEILKVQLGSVIADIGAGEGEWSLELARLVGPTGRVFANEVDPSEISKIEKAMAQAELSNVTVIQGTDTSTALEEGCCDGVLLRVVYHHFSEPEAMRADLWRILKPGGLLAVIEFPPATEHGKHGAKPETVKADLQRQGFQLVREIDRWQGSKSRYLLLFQKP